MTKVITYGTYDLLHKGHIRLLERAKQLGDFLIVGVTADCFDRSRGKINVQQSLMERIEAIRATGLADQIIVEEYEGQKIDDIKKYDVDIFTVGSDWVGKFDYLNEFCKVVYLDRTQGISSSDIRSEFRNIRIGVIGESPIINKFIKECGYVNGVSIAGICSEDTSKLDLNALPLPLITNRIDKLLPCSDAIYVISRPEKHFGIIKEAFDFGKHVLCESPVTLKISDYYTLKAIADEKGLVLMDGVKTAYSTAFERLVLLVKGGIIGDVISIDSTCTSMEKFALYGEQESKYLWNSITEWGPTALLPVFDILGTNYTDCHIITKLLAPSSDFDLFTKILLIYPHAVASVKIGQGVKSEGDLIISGTNGYVYVPAPWWKTDYFEVRYENSTQNRRFFYQLDGEGIRYEILSFVEQIESKIKNARISNNISSQTIKLIEDFYSKKFIEI